MRTKLSSFDFTLPEKLIAEYPSKERDEARLMVVHRETGKIEHKVFKDVLDYFDDGDSMIFNTGSIAEVMGGALDAISLIFSVIYIMCLDYLY